MFLFVTSEVGTVVPDIFPQHTVDVSDAMDGYNDNCCHTNVSFFVRLGILRHVRYSIFPFFSLLTV